MRQWPKIAAAGFVLVAALALAWPSSGGRFLCGPSVIVAFRKPYYPNPNLVLRGYIYIHPFTPEGAAVFNAEAPRWQDACQNSARTHLAFALTLLGAAALALLSVRPLGRALETATRQEPALERLRRPGLSAWLFACLLIIAGVSAGGVWYSLHMIRTLENATCNGPCGRPSGYPLRPLVFGTLAATLAITALPLVGWRLIETFRRERSTRDLVSAG